MRKKLWAILLIFGLAVAAVPGWGQSPLVPIGRPFTMASGFPRISNVPIDTGQSIVPIVPPNQMGIRLPNFRSLMHFPNHNVTPGVSPLPTPSTFSSLSYPNALNPFRK